MKRLMMLCGSLCLGILSLTAQTNDRKWNIGLHAGFKEYAGDWGNALLQFDPSTINNSITVGFNLNRYLNKSLDLSGMANYGSWTYYEDERQFFKVDVIHLNAALKYKFNNDYLIEENSFIQPYIFIGPGVNILQGKTAYETKGNDITLVGGAGINFKVTDVIGVSYQATYSYNLTNDDMDGRSSGNPNDAYLLQTVGVNFNIGKTPDADNDGVGDKKDKCPGTPSNARVDEFGCPIDTDGDGVADYQDKCPNDVGTANGCPDTDKDGIADREDQCPDVAGLVALKGCPDADGDGIIDSKDECPNVKGELALAGCPDADGDGIKDADDKCPDVKGIKLFNGCPDTDGDSIPDMSDMCPDQKGTLATKGCPDTDLDGVHDGIDKCPTVAGLASNEGCPEVKQEVKQLFQKALQGIQFETGKAVIKSQSNGILDAIVKVMLENPGYKLIIGGHTDDVGNDEANMTLSQNRADAVAKYLISHGVDPTKVSATGYGETKPVDSNKTKAGKARNRRVELSVEFLK